MKKTLALLLVLCMAFALCAPMALAEEPAESGSPGKAGGFLLGQPHYNPAGLGVNRRKMA